MTSGNKVREWVKNLQIVRTFGFKNNSKQRIAEIQGEHIDKNSDIVISAFFFLRHTRPQAVQRPWKDLHGFRRRSLLSRSVLSWYPRTAGLPGGLPQCTQSHQRYHSLLGLCIGHREEIPETPNSHHNKREREQPAAHQTPQKPSVHDAANNTKEREIHYWR